MLVFCPMGGAPPLEGDVLSDNPQSPRALQATDLGDLLLEKSNLDSILGLTVQQAMTNVGGAQAAGISLVVGKQVKTAAPTEDLVSEVDELQYSSQEGPCLFAIRDRASYLTVDLANDSRFPRFGPAAAKHGVNSSLSLPLYIEDRSVGALNMYSFEKRSFDEQSEKIGLEFATKAAVLLANAEAYFELSELTVHLKEALESRDVIGTAKGIIMEREGVSNDEAFNMLVKISQTTNIKLREVAAQLVETVVKA